MFQWFSSLNILQRTSLPVALTIIAAIINTAFAQNDNLVNLIKQLQTNDYLQQPNSNIDKSIDQVQKVLESDPQLPRLTRGEITELLQNITISDLPKKHLKEVQESGRNDGGDEDRNDEGREAYQRAIMYVLPYNVKEKNGNIQDLYTKPPIVKMVTKVGELTNEQVTAESTPKNQFSAYRTAEEITTPRNRPEVDITTEQIDTVTVTSTTKSYGFLEDHDTLNKYPNHRYEDKFQEKNYHQNKPVAVPETNQDDWSPMMSPKDNQPRVVNHGDLNIIQTEKKGQRKERPIRRRRPYPQTASLYHDKNKTPITMDVKAITSEIPPFSPLSINLDDVKFTGVSTEDSLDLGIPETFQKVVDGIDLKDKWTEISPPEDLTIDNLSNFTMQEDVKKLLSSIGLLPEKLPGLATTTTTIKPDMAFISDSLDPEMQELLRNFGLLPNGEAKSHPKKANLDDYIQYSKPIITADSFTSFKPLPSSSRVSEDMESFLSKFGLIDNYERRSKSMDFDEMEEKVKVKKPAAMRTTTKPPKLHKIPKIDIEIIPEDFRDVFLELGLNDDYQGSQSTERATLPQHVFHPVVNYATKDELEKLNLLLSTIKELDKLNGTISQSDLDNLNMTSLKQLSESLHNSTVASMKAVALDEKDEYEMEPLQDLSTGYKRMEKRSFRTDSDTPSVRDAHKVKRQSDEAPPFTSETTTDVSSSVKESAVETSTDNIASLLADSFPGKTDADIAAGMPPVIPDEALPPPRRNGFYFMLDWNSFLEVGEDGKNKVNIRIAPKVGDPSRFIQVKVP